MYKLLFKLIFTTYLPPRGVVAEDGLNINGDFKSIIGIELYTEKVSKSKFLQSVELPQPFMMMSERISRSLFSVKGVFAFNP